MRSPVRLYAQGVVEGNHGLRADVRGVIDGRFRAFIPMFQGGQRDHLSAVGLNALSGNGHLCRILRPALRS